MRSFSRWGCVLLLLFRWTTAGADTALLRDVSIAPAFFNPSLGQMETIHLAAALPGRLKASILDRDRFVIRHLAEQDVKGSAVLTWDGRDDAGRIVPDEAYSLKLEFNGSGRHEVYDPSAHFTPVLEEPKTRAYSRLDGILSYSLSRPARVHIQAGQARRDPATGEIAGPILRTLVDRAPRVAGAVVEKWNGMDESGTVSIPELSDFAVSIMAASLPPASMITVGNRSQAFRGYARAHRPPEAYLPRAH